MVPGSFTMDPLQVKAEPNSQVEIYPRNTRRNQLERGGGRVRKELETTEGTPRSKEKEEEGEEVPHETLTLHHAFERLKLHSQDTALSN